MVTGSLQTLTVCEIGLPTGGVGQTSPSRDTWDTMGYGQQVGGIYVTVVSIGAALGWGSDQ